MQVIEKLELDNTTVVETEGKVTSQLVFSEVEATVPLNIVEELIFRKPENSNKSAICTGFKYNNEWYFDRPDDGSYRDPLDQDEPIKYIGNAPREQGHIIVNETLQGIEFKITNVTAILPEPAYISWNGQVFDSNAILNKEVTGVDEQGNDVYTYSFKSSNTLVSFARSFNLVITENESATQGWVFNLNTFESRAEGTTRFSETVSYGSDLSQFYVQQFNTEPEPPTET